MSRTDLRGVRSTLALLGIPARLLETNIQQLFRMTMTLCNYFSFIRPMTVFFRRIIPNVRRIDERFVMLLIISDLGSPYVRVRARGYIYALWLGWWMGG